MEGKVLNAKITFKKKSLLPFVFVAPALLVHLVFVAVPSVNTLLYSLYDWNGIGSPVFVGLANFKEIFTQDEVALGAFVNNLKWLAVFVTVPIILGLLAAVAISRIKRGQSFYRVSLFLPYVLSAAIAGKIWTTLYNPYFGINTLFEKLGLHSLAGLQWLGNSKSALYAVAFVDNWHFWGFIMVLFLGALQQVDPMLYEAARVEGANFKDELIHIIIPGIMPTLTFVIITTTMCSFLTFDYVWVMTMGGPNHATEILSTWLYKNAFVMYRSGYASALCVLQCAICVLLFFVQKLVKKMGWDV